MKVVLLAGGYGTRISEESHLKPKPMIEIGEKPILWHIMKEYSHCGFNDFIICAGYKQHVIKEWFANYFLHNSDVTFDYSRGKNEMTVHQTNMEPWKVTVVDSGYNTMTGGRIKRIQKYIGDKVRRAENLREEAKKLKEEAEEIVSKLIKLDILIEKAKEYTVKNKWIDSFLNNRKCILVKTGFYILIKYVRCFNCQRAIHINLEIRIVRQQVFLLDLTDKIQKLLCTSHCKGRNDHIPSAVKSLL